MSSVVDSFQYLKDHFVKYVPYKDKYGNDKSEQIPNESHKIAKDSQGRYFVVLNQIIDVNATTIIVNNKIGTITVPDFIPYEQVASIDLITAKNKFYFDKTNGTIYFYNTQENQDVDVTYYAVGRTCISANMVYTEWDSNKNIKELLGDLVKQSKTSLEQIKGITNAESLRIQLDSQINTLNGIYSIIKNDTPTAQALVTTLNTTIPNAETATTNLNTALTNAQDAINTITLADNQYYTITSDQLVYNSSSGFYEYTLNHNLNSVKLIMSITDDDGDELVDLGGRIDSNNYLIANDEQINIHVVINKGYYGGI